MVVGSSPTGVIMAFAEYRNSKQSVGLLLHILFDCYRMMESDYWQFGAGTIQRHGVIVGAYTWNDDKTWASFEFIDERHQKQLLEGKRLWGNAGN